MNDIEKTKLQKNNLENLLNHICDELEIKKSDFSKEYGSKRIKIGRTLFVYFASKYKMGVNKLIAERIYRSLSSVRMFKINAQKTIDKGDKNFIFYVVQITKKLKIND